jgi:hypothetical protein
MYVGFYTNSLLQGWPMTRILTIIALLFATPAWAFGMIYND